MVYFQGPSAHLVHAGMPLGLPPRLSDPQSTRGGRQHHQALPAAPQVHQHAAAEQPCSNNTEQLQRYLQDIIITCECFLQHLLSLHYWARDVVQYSRNCRSYSCMQRTQLAVASIHCLRWYGGCRQQEQLEKYLCMSSSSSG